jgi:hypothetical protein
VEEDNGEEEGGCGEVTAADGTELALLSSDESIAVVFVVGDGAGIFTSDDVVEEDELV